MPKKEIQRRRIMTYFINAASEIIEKEGIEKITIRKVADKAGYNSATLYNYFENLDHLIFLAAMRYIRDYALALPEYLKDTDNALDIFIKVWECFCHFSFKNPKIYYAIFFADLNNALEDYVLEYYKLFPEDLGHQRKNISTMLLKHNIYERGMTTVNRCIDEGFIREEDAEDLNEMATLLYKGMLVKVIENKIDYNKAMEKTMKYINLVVDSLAIK